MSRNTRKPLKLFPVAGYLLYKIYDATMQNDQKSRFSLFEIENIVSKDIPRNLLKNALSLLHENRGDRSRLVARYGSKEKYEFAITRDGIIHIEESIANENTIANILYMQPDADIYEIAGFNEFSEELDDFSAVEEWRPLKIERESRGYQEAIKQVKDSIETIRNDNGFAANEPELREGLLDTLNEGLDQIENKTPSAHLIRRLLLDPFLLIAKKFGNSVIGNAGKIAADHLTRWLQSLF